MARYAVYNRMYQKKKDGVYASDMYLNLKGEYANAATAKRASDRVNATWNRKTGGKNYKAVTVKVKRLAPLKKRTTKRRK